MVIIKWSLIFIILLFISGYQTQPRILEDIQLITAIGYDYVSKDKIKGIANIPITPLAEDTPPKNEVISGVGHTSKNIRQILQARSPRPLLSGRTEVVLFNKKVAQQGVIEVIDGLERDPSIGRDIFLGVVNGNVENMLNEQYTISEFSAKYISELLKQNMDQNIPKTNFHHFLYHYYGKGMDPYMPILQKKGKFIKINGTALFKEAKFIDTISLEQSFIMKMLSEGFQDGTYETKLPDGKFVTVQNMASKIKYTILENDGNPIINIYIRINGKVNEAQRITTMEGNVINSIEKHVSSSITKEGEKLLRHFQKLEIDPLGLGHKASNQIRHFDIKEWEDKYQQIPIHVNIRVKISNTGIID
jgi:spore germination protein